MKAFFKPVETTHLSFRIKSKVGKYVSIDQLVTEKWNLLNIWSLSFFKKSVKENNFCFCAVKIYERVV